MSTERIERSDEFPVFYLAPDVLPSGLDVDLPDGFVDRFRRADAEWRECQAVMNEAWEQAEVAARRAGTWRG